MLLGGGALFLELRNSARLDERITLTVDTLEYRRSQPVMTQLNKGRQLMEMKPLSATNYSQVIEAILQTSVSTLNTLVDTNNPR